MVDFRHNLIRKLKFACLLCSIKRHHNLTRNFTSHILKFSMFRLSSKFILKLSLPDIKPWDMPTLLWEQQQPFYGPLSRTTRMSQYQKKHPPTHHPDHHPIFISFHLLRSVASSLFKLRAWQSFCTTSWSGALHLIFHTFLHPISVFFSQHMPIPSQPVLL